MIVSYKWGFIFIRTHKTASKSMEKVLALHCGEDDIISPRGPVDKYGPARNFRGVFNPFADILNEKVSSRSILRRLFRGMRYYNHMSAGQIKRRIGRTTWNSFYKFCFERNPWDKAVSHYWFQMKNPRARKRIGSFEEYLESGRCQIDYPLYTIDGELAVDRVGRYEDIEKDWEQILSHVGLPAESLSERANAWQRTNSEPYQNYYTDKTRQLVAELYANEIALFGYRFGD